MVSKLIDSTCKHWSRTQIFNCCYWKMVSTDGPGWVNYISPWKIIDQDTVFLNWPFSSIHRFSPGRMSISSIRGPFKRAVCVVPFLQANLPVLEGNPGIITANLGACKSLILCFECVREKFLHCKKQNCQHWNV